MEPFQMLRRRVTLFKLPSGLYNKEMFREDSLKLALYRLRLFLTSIILLFSLMLAADLILFRGLWDTFLWQSLIGIHLFCLAATAGLLAALRVFSGARYNHANIFFHAAILIIMVANAVFSLYTLHLAENVYQYMTIMLLLGLLFPIDPGFFTASFLVVHATFIYGLLLMDMNFPDTVTYQFSSSVAVIFAIAGNIIFYRHRVSEFIRNSQIKVGEEFFQHITLSASRPLLVCDLREGRLLFANRSAQSYFELDPDGPAMQFRIDSLYASDGEWEEIHRLLDEQGVLHNFIAEQRTTSGELKWTIGYYAVIEYLGRKAVLCDFSDITKIKQKEQALAVSASSDPLTGIFNRRKGMELLYSAISGAQCSGIPFVLCFLDIDGLKSVNDSYGHEEGDRLIISVCNIIKKMLDDRDIFYRHGGDEFVILFMDKDLAAANAIYSRIIRRLDMFSEENGRPYHVSVSGGMCECRAGERLSCEQLLKEADREMYKQKKRRVEQHV